jgi:hypothetical protein
MAEDTPRPPSLPVGTGESFVISDGLTVDERRARGMNRFHAIVAGFTGGMIGFPALLAVSRIVGWQTREIPGLAGAMAWICGSAAVYGLLRWQELDRRPPAA